MIKVFNNIYYIFSEIPPLPRPLFRFSDCHFPPYLSWSHFALPFQWSVRSFPWKCLRHFRRTWLLFPERSTGDFLKNFTLSPGSLPSLRTPLLCLAYFPLKKPPYFGLLFQPNRSWSNRLGQKMPKTWSEYEANDFFNSRRSKRKR